jgi:hypothetical protein
MIIFIINSHYFYKNMINYFYQMNNYGMINYYNYNNLLINIIKDHQHMIIIKILNN